MKISQLRAGTQFTAPYIGSKVNTVTLVSHDMVMWVNPRGTTFSVQGSGNMIARTVNNWIEEGK